MEGMIWERLYAGRDLPASVYHSLRKATAGVIPTFESTILLAKTEITDYDRNDPYLQSMHEICCDHIAYANDLYSTAKENNENFNFNN